MLSIAEEILVDKLIEIMDKKDGAYGVSIGGTSATERTYNYNSYGFDIVVEVKTRAGVVYSGSVSMYGSKLGVEGCVEVTTNPALCHKIIRKIVDLQEEMGTFQEKRKAAEKLSAIGDELSIQFDLKDKESVLANKAIEGSLHLNEEVEP